MVDLMSWARQLATTDPQAPAVLPLTEPTGPPPDPFLDAFNIFFDAAVLACPNDWLDRQIRKVQGALAAKWAVIGPYLHAQFAQVPPVLHTLIDAGLQALSVATLTRPLIHAAVNIVRGVIDAAWDDIFPKAQPALAAKGIKV